MAKQTLLDNISPQLILPGAAKDFRGAGALLVNGQDAAQRFRVVNRTTVDQPGSPSEGDAYLIAPTGTVTGADWAGALSVANDDLVFYRGAAWAKATLFNGMEVFDLNDGARFVRIGGQWIERDQRWFEFAGGAHDGTDLDIAKRVADETRTLVIIGGAARIPTAGYSIAINTPAAGQTRFTFSPTLDTAVTVAILA